MQETQKVFLKRYTIVTLLSFNTMNVDYTQLKQP